MTAEAATPNAQQPTPNTSPVTSVVLPVYNERDNLPQLVDELQQTFTREEMTDYRPYEVLWIEDGSTDGTSAYVDDLAATHPNHRAVHLKRNWGQSAALAAGFDHAQGDMIVPMDADLQNDPRDIPQLLQTLTEGYDCVSGWRRDRDDPLAKRVPSRIQTTLAKATGPDINDFGCTLTAYQREALEDIQLYGEGHRYIPAKLYDKGYSVTEVEVNHRPRKHGESRYGVARLVRGFVDLLFHVFWVRYSTRPLHFLGGTAFVFMGVGGILGGVSVVQKYVFGMALAPRTPRLILTALLIIAGVQLLVLGVLAEMLTSLHYRDDEEYRVDRIVG